MLPPVIRNKALCQEALLSPWWRHIQNIISFQNLELDTLSKVKPREDIDQILYF